MNDKDQLIYLQTAEDGDEERRSSLRYTQSAVKVDMANGKEVINISEVEIKRFN